MKDLKVKDQNQVDKKDHLSSFSGVQVGSTSQAPKADVSFVKSKLKKMIQEKVSLFGTRLSKVPEVGFLWPQFPLIYQRTGKDFDVRPASSQTSLFARHMSVWLFSSQSWLPAASWLLLVDPRTHRRHLEPWQP